MDIEDIQQNGFNLSEISQMGQHQLLKMNFLQKRMKRIIIIKE